MSSGKHLICDIKNIKNLSLLNDIDGLKNMFDYICEKYDYHILHKVQHQFEPHGVTIIYMLSESHMSIHTFPEKEYAALDIYTCREYKDNSVYLDIQEYLKKMFESSDDSFTIVEREYGRKIIK